MTANSVDNLDDDAISNGLRTQAPQSEPVPSPVTRRSSRWLQLDRFTRVEVATYLRDPAAIFWTFLYPIVLLVVLMALFGGGNSGFSARVQVEGSGPGAERFASLLEQRFAAIDPDLFELERVEPATPPSPGVVRVVVPAVIERVAETPATIVVRYSGAIGPESGSMLSIVGETVSALNLELSGAPAAVAVEYAITDDASGSSSSAIYYVVGLAVLTIISTALFGFSGPLIDLRARGGFRQLLFAPIDKAAFLGGFVLCRLIILLVFVVMFLALGLLVYGGTEVVAQADWGVLILLCVAGTLAFLAAGLALAGLVSNNTLASAVINFINLPIMFLSDLFIPIGQLPDMIQSVAMWSPIYLLVDAMREAASGAASHVAAAPALASLCALLVLSILITATTFRWRTKR